MHMADGLISPAVAGIMYAGSMAVTAYSIKKVKSEKEDKKIPLMGVMGAFVFAAQMINFAIPGTGSSGHLGGGMLLSAILGPYAGFLSMTGILMIQALLFADGGLLALGANLWNLAFYGCFIGAFGVWRLWMRKGISRKKIMAASIIGAVLTAQLGALSVTLQTLASGMTQLPFSLFAGTMLPIHLVIGAVEGMISAAVLCFIYHARPELLWIGSAAKSGKFLQGLRQRLSLKQVLLILLTAVILTGGGLSLLASSNPDGLEWAVEKVSLGEKLSIPDQDAYHVAETVQGTTAIFSDYTVPYFDADSGTAVSGILGSLAVILFCTAVCVILRFFRKKIKNEKN